MEVLSDFSPYSSHKVQIKRELYYDAEQSWGVFSCQDLETKKELSIRGNMPFLKVGERLLVEGSWVKDKKFGRQFSVEKLIPFIPEKGKALIKYLSSDLFPGIGQQTARKIVDHFGEKTLSVLDDEMDRLGEVKGVSQDKLRGLRRTWKQVTKTRGDLLFLYRHGVTGKTAQKVLDAYGQNLQEEIKSNPYSLMSLVRGFSFLRADNMALSLGLEVASPDRIKSSFLYLLSEGEKKGNCYLPEEELLNSSFKLLGLDSKNQRVLFLNALLELESYGFIVRCEGGGGSCVYLERTFRAEKSLASRVKELSKRELPKKEVSDIKARAKVWLEKYLERVSIKLDEEQEKAVVTCVTHPFSLLTGGPGVGKSLTSKIILHLFFAMKKTVALASPTGRAAKRLSELTGYEAKTIHRLLEWSPKEKKFLRSEKTPLEVDVLIVDEASMLDVFLADKLFRALKEGSQIVLIGDCDQLPSIGPGHVLAHLLESGVCPVARLKKIFRQGEASAIVSYSHEINQGKIPSFSSEGVTDCHFFKMTNALEVKKTLKNFLEEGLPKYGFSVRDVQVLCPMNKGNLGCQNLNKEIQTLFHSRLEKDPSSLGNGKYDFSKGDRVIQLVNNYDLGVFNGDIGYVVKVDSKEKSLCVDFSGNLVIYEKEQLSQLGLAYAITIHKSQGSEFPVVLLPLVPEYTHMMTRNLLYTALTRGRQLAVFLGFERILHLAIKRRETVKRYSLLKERIR